MASLAVDVPNSSSSSMEEDISQTMEEEPVAKKVVEEVEEEVGAGGDALDQLDGSDAGENEDDDDDDDDVDELPDLGELKDICRGLMSHFDRDDDVATVRQILSVAASTHQAVARAEYGPKETIRALSAENAVLQENCERRGEPREVAAKRLAKLHQQKVSEESELARMRAAEENALRSIQNLEERHAQARGEIAQVRDVAAVEIPRVKYALSLYANISNIVWDYSEVENIKGMITSPTGEPTKSFNIDPCSATNFDITNQLWDLMDSP